MLEYVESVCRSVDIKRAVDWEIIKLLLKDRRATLADVAEKTGKSKQAISKKISTYIEKLWIEYPAWGNRDVAERMLRILQGRKHTRVASKHSRARILKLVLNQQPARKKLTSYYGVKGKKAFSLPKTDVS